MNDNNVTTSLNPTAFPHLFPEHPINQGYINSRVNEATKRLLQIEHKYNDKINKNVTDSVTVTPEFIRELAKQMGQELQMIYFELMGFYNGTREVQIIVTEKHQKFRIKLLIWQKIERVEREQMIEKLPSSVQVREWPTK